MCTAPAGSRPIAVSWDSITASVPSKIAFDTSATSARVGRVEWTIDSSICVAVIAGLAFCPAMCRMFFWTSGTSSIGSSMPRSPRATITPSAASTISAAFAAACGFSIFAITGRSRPPSASRARTGSRSSRRRMNESAIMSTPISSPASIRRRSSSLTAGSDMFDVRQVQALARRHRAADLDLGHHLAVDDLPLPAAGSRRRRGRPRRRPRRSRRARGTRSAAARGRPRPAPA